MFKKFEIQKVKESRKEKKPSVRRNEYEKKRKPIKSVSKKFQRKKVKSTK